MVRSRGGAASSERRAAETARLAVERLGGRFSRELGLDPDRGGEELERWFLAATLFGTRISAAIAMRTYRTLAGADISTIAEVAGRRRDELIALLDAGGYARYDERTASRLRALQRAVQERTGDGVAPLLESEPSPAGLARALDELPGVGPTTVRIFLRELRGRWPGAEPPVDPRALEAARHLGLLDEQPAPPAAWLAQLADAAGIDPRDLESALVRLALVHRRALPSCPGGRACVALASSAGPRSTGAA